jgi:hypothetical protein
MYHFCGFHTFSVQLEAGKQKSVQLEAGPTPMIEWTQEALLRRFGLPADWMPATSAEFDDFDARCIDLLREPANVSGFKEVYACLGDKPWQAKVYVLRGAGEAAAPWLLCHGAGGCKGHLLVAGQRRQAQLAQEGSQQAW